MDRTGRAKKPTHPGAVLREDYLKEVNISVTAFAGQLGVSRKTLSKILNERGAITPEMALRLSRALGTTPNVWLNMQMAHDLWTAEHASEGWKAVTRMCPPFCAA